MKHLPIIGTSAPVTAYCAAELAGDDQRSLWLDGNGKITWSNGTLADPKPNAFSIVNKLDCPERTPTCEASCYVEDIRKHAADTFTLYEHNSRTIREILMLDIEERIGWAHRLGRWIVNNAAGGFRWHVSGDLFDARYAAWVGSVVRVASGVQHWIYTRSFTLLPALLGSKWPENLALNLSCDVDNYQRARDWRTWITDEQGRSPRLCYLTRDGVVPDDLPSDSVIFPDYALRGGTPRGRDWWTNALVPHQRKMVCPVDFHGKDEHRRCGPCSRCLT